MFLKSRSNPALLRYPIHSKPKNNQTFMYVNLAVSLAIDLGLHSKDPIALNFNSIRQEGLIADGSFTQSAKRAYLGAYYILAAFVYLTLDSDFMTNYV